MRILLTGGGTGGHITPILAVAHELKQRNPAVHIIYVGERAGKFADLTKDNQDIDEIHTIFAGKFRRYHGENLLQKLLDVPTILLNLRDLVFVVIGMFQALLLVLKLWPDAVLLKGGYVGVPVGIASALLKRPFVTHDSDALPGLANRLVSRWARHNAVALDTAIYPYAHDKVVQVGVLVESGFVPVDQAAQTAYKEHIGAPADATVLLVTGSSSGSVAINKAICLHARTWLADFPDLYIVHQTGKGKQDIYGDFKHKRLKVLAFMRPMYTYTGAADIVVCRVSGNTLAELGTQGKAVIGIPSPHLAGGHQLKNADQLVAAHAIMRVTESAAGVDANELDMVFRELMADPRLRAHLAQNLSGVVVKDAVSRLANLIVEAAGEESDNHA